MYVLTVEIITGWHTDVVEFEHHWNCSKSFVFVNVACVKIYTCMTEMCEDSGIYLYINITLAVP